MKFRITESIPGFKVQVLCENNIWYHIGNFFDNQKDAENYMEKYASFGKEGFKVILEKEFN